MTTNQTIDGVPRLRELLDKLDSLNVDEFQGWAFEVGDELRALLDSDECCHEFVPFQANCTKCGIPYKTAAQPQGEPVAVLIRLDRSYRNGLMDGFQFGIIGDEKGYAACIQRYNEGIQAAKAEQPAPVAVGLPVDPERERLMETVQQYPNVNPLEYDAAVRTLRK